MTMLQETNRLSAAGMRGMRQAVQASLPADAGDATLATSFDSANRSSKIMLVDDEPITIKVSRKYLEGAGYRSFATLCDATQAVEMVHREKPDILLLDVVMPEVNGLQILETIRADEKLCRLPVIILTGAHDKETKAKALGLGATDFLPKPIDPIDLVLRVRNVLAVKHYQDHLEREIQRQLRQLSREARRITMIIDTGNDAFIAADQQGRVTEWSANAERLFGWTCGEMVGRSLDAVLAPCSGRNGEEANLQSLLESGIQGKRMEMKAREREGREFPVEVSISSMQLDDEIIFNAFVHDVSEKQALQMQLTQAQKLESIGQLAAGIAHEINTPTQFISDNTRFLQEAFGDFTNLLAGLRRLLQEAKSGTLPRRLITELETAAEQADLDFLLEETSRAIEQSQEGLDRVTKIVRAMKEFSHPGIASQKTEVDLNRAIESTLTISRNEWKYVADVTTDFDPNLPPTLCLAGEFNQVMLNLIINAAQAIAEALGENSEQKGAIAISTRRVEDWAEIRVKDTGAGIAKEHRSKIFDLFFTTKEVGKGTGQGLAFARSIVVDKHGGTIDFETEEGQGTTFIIRLPIN